MTNLHQTSPSVVVREVDSKVGMGMFTTQPVSKGEVVYTDIPLVSIQHTANRRFISACQCCNRRVGSIRHQFATIFNEERFSKIDLSVLPSIVDSVPVYCECGEVYCSPECAGQSFAAHHRFLCVAANPSGAVFDFKVFCLSIPGCGDNLLLLAQLLCVLATRAEGIYANFDAQIREMLTYTNLPFHQVARPGFGQARDAEWENWLAETIGEAFGLLAKALCGQSEILGHFFSNSQSAFETCSRILSVFELNNVDIAIPNDLSAQVAALPLSDELVNILREKEVVMTALWNDESRGVYDDDDDDDEMEDAEGEDHDDSDDSDDMDDCQSCDEDVDSMLKNIREEVSTFSAEKLVENFPIFHGTGFFSSVARTNHSCAPNVSMDYVQGTNRVSCVASESVGKGSELRMSYIGNPSAKSKAARNSQLEDYLFQCNCSLCSLC